MPTSALEASFYANFSPRNRFSHPASVGMPTETIFKSPHPARPDEAADVEGREAEEEAEEAAGLGEDPAERVEPVLRPPGWVLLKIVSVGIPTDAGCENRFLGLKLA